MLPGTTLSLECVTNWSGPSPTSNVRRLKKHLQRMNYHHKELFPIPFEISVVPIMETTSSDSELEVVEEEQDVAMDAAASTLSTPTSAVASLASSREAGTILEPDVPPDEPAKKRTKGVHSKNKSLFAHFANKSKVVSKSGKSSGLFWAECVHWKRKR